jgi:hypothetical protein
MSVQLVVKGGPDAGRTYSLSSGTTVIGRGANAQIRVADPSLHGSIIIDAAGGAVRVRHDLPHPIYLNRQSFPPGETRTWFHGHEIQPTADTVLVMRLLGEEADQPAASKNGQWILAIGIGVLAVILFVTPSEESTADKMQGKDRPELVQSGLLQLATNRPNDPAATALPRLLAAARAMELRQRNEEAFEAYTRLRDALLACEALPRRSSESFSADEEAAVAAAKRLLNGRLIELSPRKKEY